MMKLPSKVCSDLVRSFLRAIIGIFLVRAFISYKTTLLLIYDRMNTSGIKAELCTSRIKIKSDYFIFRGPVIMNECSQKKIMKET